MQLSLHRSTQRCTAGQHTASAAQSPRVPQQHLRSLPAVQKQRMVTCAAVSVDTEASALPTEKSGSNFKAVMDIEAIKAILPHRYRVGVFVEGIEQRGMQDNWLTVVMCTRAHVQYRHTLL